MMLGGGRLQGRSNVYIAPALNQNQRQQMLLEQQELTNMDRFRESVTPEVPAGIFSYKGYQNRWRGNGEVHLSYSLGDLWESLEELSIYGVGVPFVLNGEHLVQYYVPSLSAIQLYVNSTKNPLSLKSASENGHRRGELVFEYMENAQPYDRMPLTDKVSTLAANFPGLMDYRSNDLLPTSWMSIAWYPIYRTPMGSTRKDLEAAFLTFHYLSTNAKGNDSPWSYEIVDGSGSNRVPKIRLPVFGMATYKLRGSILSPSSLLECDRENYILQKAERWIQHMQVRHPDLEFFTRRYLNSQT